MPTATAPITNGVESSSSVSTVLAAVVAAAVESGAAAVVAATAVVATAAVVGGAAVVLAAVVVVVLTRKIGYHDNGSGIFRLAAVRVRRLDPSDLADLAGLDDGEQQDLIRCVREPHGHA